MGFFDSVNGESVEQVKNRLIDSLLLFGALLATLIYLVALLPFDASELSLDTFSDAIGIAAFFVIYVCRNAIKLTHKTAFIIIITYTLFLTDLVQNGLNSTIFLAVCIIPFLCVLIFTARFTIIVSMALATTFITIGLLFLNGTLQTPYSFPINSNPYRWVDTGLLISLVSFIFTLFVYNYNNSIEAVVSTIKSKNVDLEKRDLELQEKLEENEVLLQEIHHRVKNNLTVVIGLLTLQASKLDNRELQTVLTKSINRVISIGKVHELLYTSKDYAQIPIDAYLTELAKQIIQSINQNEKEIELFTHINLASINVNLGIPLGIILNELITNSINHGFESNSKNSIRIEIEDHNYMVSVNYEDNGSGITNFNEEREGGLGFTIIESLLSQIDATYSYKTEDGFALTFSFKKNQ